MADNAHTIDIQDNRTVVGLLRAGDEKCFDALFRRYYKPLCTYATRFVPPVRAEELVQDTLMWVWENRADSRDAAQIAAVHHRKEQVA